MDFIQSSAPESSSQCMKAMEWVPKIDISDAVALEGARELHT